MLSMLYRLLGTGQLTNPVKENPTEYVNRFIEEKAFTETTVLPSFTRKRTFYQYERTPSGLIDQEDMSDVYKISVIKEVWSRFYPGLLFEGFDFPDPIKLQDTLERIHKTFFSLFYSLNFEPLENKKESIYKLFCNTDVNSFLYLNPEFRNQSLLQILTGNITPTKDFQEVAQYFPGMMMRIFLRAYTFQKPIFSWNNTEKNLCWKILRANYEALKMIVPQMDVKKRNKNDIEDDFFYIALRYRGLLIQLSEETRSNIAQIRDVIRRLEQLQVSPSQYEVEEKILADYEDLDILRPVVFDEILRSELAIYFREKLRKFYPNLLKFEWSIVHLVKFEIQFRREFSLFLENGDWKLAIAHRLRKLSDKEKKYVFNMLQIKGSQEKLEDLVHEAVIIISYKYSTILPEHIKLPFFRDDEFNFDPWMGNEKLKYVCDQAITRIKIASFIEDKANVNLTNETKERVRVKECYRTYFKKIFINSQILLTEPAWRDLEIFESYLRIQKRERPSNLSSNYHMYCERATDPLQNQNPDPYKGLMAKIGMYIFVGYPFLFNHNIRSHMPNEYKNYWLKKNFEYIVKIYDRSSSHLFMPRSPSADALVKLVAPENSARNHLLSLASRASLSVAQEEKIVFFFENFPYMKNSTTTYENAVLYERIANVLFSFIRSEYDRILFVSSYLMFNDSEMQQLSKNFDLADFEPVHLEACIDLMILLVHYYLAYDVIKNTPVINMQQSADICRKILAVSATVDAFLDNNFLFVGDRFEQIHMAISAEKRQTIATQARKQAFALAYDNSDALKNVARNSQALDAAYKVWLHEEQMKKYADRAFSIDQILHLRNLDQKITPDDSASQVDGDASTVGSTALAGYEYARMEKIKEKKLTYYHRSLIRVKKDKTDHEIGIIKKLKEDIKSRITQVFIGILAVASGFAKRENTHFLDKPLEIANMLLGHIPEPVIKAVCAVTLGGVRFFVSESEVQRFIKMAKNLSEFGEMDLITTELTGCILEEFVDPFLLELEKNKDKEDAYEKLSKYLTMQLEVNILMQLKSRDMDADTIHLGIVLFEEFLKTDLQLNKAMQSNLMSLLY